MAEALRLGARRVAGLCVPANTRFLLSVTGLNEEGLLLSERLTTWWAALESRRAVYLFLGLGLLLRVAALAAVGSAALGNEAPGYYRMALAILHDEDVSLYWPPGVPYYLYACQRLLGEGIVVARASIIPLYVVFSIFLYRLARIIVSRRAASLLVLIFAVYPPYVRYAFNPSTEYPAAALLAGMLYFAIRAARTGKALFAIASGACGGALTLVRPSCVLFLLAVPMYCYLLTKRVRLAVIPFLVGSIVVSIWLVKAHSLGGRWVFINESNAENLFFGNNPYTPLYRTWPEGQAEIGFPPGFRKQLDLIRNEPEEIRGRSYMQIALGHITSRPDLFLLRSVNRMRAYFGFPVHHGEPLKRFSILARPPWLVPFALTVLDLMFYWPLMVLAILCVFSCLRAPVLDSPIAAIVAAAALYPLPYWISFSQPRFNFPVIPLLAVLAVKFLDFWAARSASQSAGSMLESGSRRVGAFATLILFAYIQLEWIAVFYFKVW